jgi:hypothetical protein
VSSSSGTRRRSPADLTDPCNVGEFDPAAGLHRSGQGDHPDSRVWIRPNLSSCIGDEHAGQRLARAIQGKGPFRRFTVVLHEEYPQLLPAWYAFRDARAHRRAVEWLADNSLVDDGAATRFLDEHSQPRCRHPYDLS